MGEAESGFEWVGNTMIVEIGYFGVLTYGNISAARPKIEIIYYPT